MPQRPEPLRWLALLLPVLPCVSQAQGVSRGLDARLGASLLVSDNLGGGPGAEDAGAVFTVTPGVAYRLRSGAAVADVDYQASLLVPIRVSTPVRRIQNALRAQARLADADSGLALAVRGDVGQQTQSLLGPQRGSSDVTGANRSEVVRASIEPSWQRRLGGVAELQLSHALQASNTRRSVVGDSTQQSTTAAFRGLNRGPLTWGLQLQRSDTRIRQGRDTYSELGRVTLDWQPDVDWRFGVSGGHERSDLVLGEERSRTIYGASVRWQPGPRTVMSGSFEERVAGRTHAIDLQHRFVRSSLVYRDSRSITQPGAVGATGALSNFDLLYAQFASIEPDPDRRGDLVRSVLQQQGLDPNAVATQGFIAGRNALSRTRSLSGAYTMVRTTFTVSLTRTDSERLGAPGEASDDFSLAPTLSTRGASVSVSHRLTPLSGVSLLGQYQRNEGAGLQGGSTLKTVTVSMTTQLAPRSQASLSLRHGSFSAAQNPYVETVLLASLNHQF